MNNLKTVIEGLDLCLEGLCDICPYKNSNAPGGCKDELMCDAFALLREYAEMEKRFSQVLMETTGNLLSKTTYTVPAIMDCIREHYCDDCDIHEKLDALLKAQEPIKPQEKREGDYRNLYCGACRGAIVGYIGHLNGKYFKLSDYCSCCGKPVKWE